LIVEFFTNSRMKERNKRAILILGPTAVGKTAVAIQAAQNFRTSIISADSRQCFRELTIGVSKPSTEELLAVHHYFINSHSIADTIHAALFEQWAMGWIAEIFQEQDVAVMAGGTGLYVKAFCEGLDEMPIVSESVRKQIQQQYGEYGLEWLQHQIREKDPEFYKDGEILNPQRLMRALEVVLSTGRSIYSFRNKISKQRSFEIRKFGLELPKELLHRSIHTRVDLMMDAGLLEEVKSLQFHRNLNALQTVGYSELFSYLDGDISLEHAVDLIKKNTRHYAKRQMTWFRKDPTIEWIHPGDIEKIIKP
jgi:tRNA dimethylallyltransferase